MQNKKLYIGFGFAVLLIGVAAFVGGQFLNRKLAQGNRSFIVAKELPQWAPDATGLFVRREDNSIFIGIGGINIDAGANDEPMYSFDGPVVEIVIHSKTSIYEDVTNPDLFSLSDIQQKVAKGTIEEIDATRKITVWGRKVGDRIIADVLLYSDLALLFMDGRTPEIKSLYDK